MTIDRREATLTNLGPLPPEVLDRAARYVASRALDPADARELLQMLGLLR